MSFLPDTLISLSSCWYSTIMSDIWNCLSRDSSLCSLYNCYTKSECFLSNLLKGFLTSIFALLTCLSKPHLLILLRFFVIINFSSFYISFSFSISNEFSVSFVLFICDFSNFLNVIRYALDLFTYWIVYN